MLRIRVIILALICMPGYSLQAQTKQQLDSYERNFDGILNYTPDETQRIEKIRAEVPAEFFQKKGFYALTKAVETKSISFIEFILAQPGVRATDVSVLKENILAFLPWDPYKIVKPGTCARTDTLLELRKRLTTYFVKKGVSISHIDSGGKNIMMQAVMNKDLVFLQFLYELNGNKLVNTQGEDLLYYSCYVGCIDIAKWLVEHGLDVNTVNKFEGSAIGAAVRHPEIVRYLLSKGANPNLTKVEGWTPLMYAANYDNTQSIQLLLDAGADLKVINSRGLDAYHVAIEYKRKEAEKMLKEAMKKGS